MSDPTDKRDVLLGYVEYLYEFPDSPRRASPDAILNELHQNGWAVVPKDRVVQDGTMTLQLVEALLAESAAEVVTVATNKMRAAVEFVAAQRMVAEERGDV